MSAATTIAIVHAVAETVRAAGADGVPEGTIYAPLCGVLDAAGFDAVVRTLVGAGLVARSNHLLTWAGPTLPAEVSL